METSRLAVRQFTVRRRFAARYQISSNALTLTLRVEDIPRRLEAYFKARGYYDVKVVADGTPDVAVNGRVPVHIVVSPGAVYHFDGVTVTGLRRLHPSFVTKRFTRLEGKTYSPDVLDERFRTLMQTGQFNLLQIKPVPVDGHLLRLDISAEEAKSKEFGFWGGFDTYEGALAGVQVGDRDLFGYGRPLTATIEVSQRSYRGEILYEDPFFFDTDFVFTAKAFALTLITMGTQNLNWADDWSSAAKLRNMTRRR